MAATPTPEAVLEAANDDLMSAANELGPRDGHRGPDPHSTAPLAGQIDMAGRLDRHRSNLQRAQRDHKTRLEHGRGTLAAQLTEAQAGRIPATAAQGPLPHLRASLFDGWEPTALAAIAVGETLTIHDPLARALGISNDPVKAWFAASVFGVAPAVFAHLFGQHTTDTRSPSSLTRTRARRAALGAALIVVLVAVVAVCARVYSDRYTATINNTLLLGAASIWMFCAVQAVFAAANLAIGTTWHRRQATRHEHHRHHVINQLTADHEAVSQQITDLPHNERNQSAELTRTYTRACALYHTHIANTHPDPYSAVLWLDRTHDTQPPTYDNPPSDERGASGDEAGTEDHNRPNDNPPNGDPPNDGRPEGAGGTGATTAEDNDDTLIDDILGL